MGFLELLAAIGVVKALIFAALGPPVAAAAAKEADRLGNEGLELYARHREKVRQRRAEEELERWREEMEWEAEWSRRAKARSERAARKTARERAEEFFGKEFADMASARFGKEPKDD
ncbi:MAG: hypothetical protein AB1486_18690 [Planctomycetota bacterium]